MSKCAIFDCDGTLVDSELLCNRALAMTLRELGIVERPEALVQRYRGGKLAWILDDLAGLHRASFDDNFVERYRATVARMFDHELQPIAGALRALERIVIPKCVASSGPLSKIKHALRVCGLAKFFGPRLFSSYEVNSWKPQPDLFLHAARTMGVHENDCVVIDDSTLGIEAGCRAGMRVLFFSPHDTTTSLEYPNVRTFRSMDELPHLLAED